MNNQMNKKKWIQRNGAVFLIAGICCLLWGSAFPCVKIGYRLFQIDSLDTATQILFAGMRFTLAGLMVILFISVRERKFTMPRHTSWGMIAKLSLFQTILQYLFFYIGLARTTGVKSSIIIGCNVFVAICISSLIFHMERMTWNKCIGCVVGFAGVVLINLNGGTIDFHLSFLGEGMIFLSTFAYSISSVLIKKYATKESTEVLSGYQFLIGGILLSLVGMIAGGRIEKCSTEGLLMLVYLAIISSVAYTLWSYMLKYNPVSKVAVFGFMNPIFGVLTSILLLPGESTALGLMGVLALLFVIAGIMIVNKTVDNLRN